MPKKKQTIFEGNLARHEIDAEPEEFLESEEHEGTHDEEELKIHTGQKEADIYTEEGREELTEDDEMEPWEEGFAEGATGRGQKAHCPVCGKILSQDESEIVEREYRGETYWFCSDKCAKTGVKKK
ncbi:hypothetical protein HY484_01930 [Candidatus Woesearchaeota archaeon]|nr:hypothetical protein [Candidatus Woesearchaeota archaeon]